MPAPPDPLNDEDLLGLDVPDILHALLAPMESPASYQQQGHGPCAPLPQILLAHSLCAPNVDDASVGNLIAPAPAPALVAATVPVHNASGDDLPSHDFNPAQLKRYLARRRFEQQLLVSMPASRMVEAASKAEGRRQRAMKRVRGPRGRYLPRHTTAARSTDSCRLCTRHMMTTHGRALRGLLAWLSLARVVRGPSRSPRHASSLVSLTHGRLRLSPLARVPLSI